MAENKSNTIEEWRPVVGYEGLYEVSSLGHIYSFPRKGNYGRGGGRVLKFGTDGRRYLQVRLYRNGKLGTFRIHTIVAAAFLGPRPDWATEIRHLDGNCKNNDYTNLKYGTRLENVQDRLRHGPYHRNRSNRSCA